MKETACVFLNLREHACDNEENSVRFHKSVRNQREGGYVVLYPILNDARVLIDLSGLWKFRLDDGSGFEQGWTGKPLPEPELIAVPASYNDQKEKMEYRDHYGWAFYQKELEIPGILLSQRIVLHFGSVTHEARVYLNGELICCHKGGFLPFEAEITDHIISGKNLLCVAVDNKVDHSTLPVGNESGAAFFGSGLPDIESVRKMEHRPSNLPNFDFFNYAGIHRPVKLYTTPESYIEDITIVPDVDGTDGIIRYEVETVGKEKTKVTILDPNGKVAAEGNGASGEFRIRDARLWEPGHPWLYTADIRYGQDHYTQKFGIRTVKTEGDKFLINGKPFYFKGFGKHEDSTFHGRGLDEVLNVKDLSLMRWMHANSFRTSHYPYSEEMMNLCDEEGIVVIDEVPAVGLSVDEYEKDPIGFGKYNAEHHREVIRDLIRRDKNHPCVVMWSIANEPNTEVQPQAAYDYFKPLYDLAHEQDPQNRPVTLVVCQNDYVKDITAPAMDVICLNRYYGWYLYGGDLALAQKAFACEMEHWKKTGKPVMLTEYGADTVAGLHNTVPGMFSEEYQMEYYQAMNEVLDNCSFVVGEQLWNFADFATVQGLMRVDGNKKGILTRDRRPKMAAHYCRNRWKEIPDFHLW